MTENTNKKLDQFLTDFFGACASLQTIDGQTLVKDGKLTDESVPINETKLSQTDEEAIQEASYIKTRKTGEEIGNEEEAKVERVIRDVLEHKSKGFMYGKTGDK